MNADERLTMGTGCQEGPFLSASICVHLWFKNTEAMLRIISRRRSTCVP